MTPSVLNLNFFRRILNLNNSARWIQTVVVVQPFLYFSTKWNFQKKLAKTLKFTRREGIWPPRGRRQIGTGLEGRRFSAHAEKIDKNLPSSVPVALVTCADGLGNLCLLVSFQKFDTKP